MHPLPKKITNSEYPSPSLTQNITVFTLLSQGYPEWLETMDRDSCTTIFYFALFFFFATRTIVQTKESWLNILPAIILVTFFFTRNQWNGREKKRERDWEREGHLIIFSPLYLVVYWFRFLLCCFSRRQVGRYLFAVLLLDFWPSFVSITRSRSCKCRSRTHAGRKLASR